MTTSAQTVAGSVLSVASALPATYDAAGFAALTYSAVAEVTDIGTFGKDFTLVTHNPIGDRKTYKFRGSYNNGTLDLKLAKITVLNTDAGQAALTTALNDPLDKSISLRIALQDGSKQYFTGKVMSFTTSIGSVNSILAGECKIEIDSDVVESAT